MSPWAQFDLSMTKKVHVLDKIIGHQTIQVINNAGMWVNNYFAGGQWLSRNVG